MTLAQDMLLEDIVKAEPGPGWNELVRRHGPILPEQTPFLLEKARGSSAKVRLNATRLLLLVRGPDAREQALRTLAGETDDAQVFALAASGLADGKPLAAARPELVKKALRSGDGDVASAALRLAWLASLPGIGDELSAKLDDHDDEVRAAAAHVLGDAGAGPLEGKLRAILADPAQRGRYPLEPVYRALTASDDPTTGELFTKSRGAADVNAELALVGAIHTSPNRKPWLRTLALDLAGHDGRLRWKYFDAVADWGEATPTADLVHICAQHLEKFTSTDYKNDPVAKIADSSGVASCVAFLRKVSGQATMDMNQSLAFAKGWTG